MARPVPFSGQIAERFHIDSVREVVVGNFRIVYQVFSETEVNIMTFDPAARL